MRVKKQQHTSRIGLAATGRMLVGLLSRSERHHLLLVMVGSTLGSVLSVGGLASIMPFLSALVSSGPVTEQPLLGTLFRMLGFQDVSRYTVFLGLAAVSFIVASNILLALLTWMTTSYTRSLGSGLTERLLGAYLRQPYAFFLGTTKADVTRKLFGEVRQVVSGIVRPCIEIVSKTALSLAILVFLFAVNPVVASVVGGTLGGLYIVVFTVVRRALRRLGLIRVAANTRRFAIVYQILGGAKDIKLRGSESVFAVRFAEAVRAFERAVAGGQVISQLPRFLLEAVAFGGLLGIALWLYARADSVATSIPLISAFALAGYRLLPSLQTVFASASSMRISAASLIAVSADLEQLGREAPTAAARVADRGPRRMLIALDIEDVSYTYEGMDVSAVHNVSMHIPAGARVGIFGRTGTGKTTIADIILGLHHPQTGRYLVDGLPLDESTMRGWQSRMGYVPQSVFLADDTVTRNVAFGVPDEDIDTEAVRAACRVARIADFVEAELPQAYDTVLGDEGTRLSGGQRQRIAIARALYWKPVLLVLDEATNALDHATESAVIEGMSHHAPNTAFVVITHRLSAVKTCDVVCLVDQGTIVEQGTYEDLLAGSSRFRAMVSGNHPTGRSVLD